MKSKAWIVILVGASGMMALSGCGGGAQLKLPPMVPAGGVVTFSGKPLSGAQLFFHPIDAAGRSSAAVSDTSGAFALLTSGQPGVVPGKYKVTVQCFTKTDGSPLQITPEDQANGMDLDQMIAGGLVKLSVPKRYLAIDTTPLMIEVADAGTENLELALH